MGCWVGHDGLGSADDDPYLLLLSKRLDSLLVSSVTRLFLCLTLEMDESPQTRC